jgi:hypothetical protein
LGIGLGVVNKRIPLNPNPFLTEEPQLHIYIQFILKIVYMSKSWGPVTWLFLHTLVEKFSDEQYLIVKDELLSYTKKICSILPCPDCAKHAINYLKPIKSIETKTLFVNMLFQFHNSVNYKTKKIIMPYNELAKYKKLNLKVLYNVLLNEYNKQVNNTKMLLGALMKRQILMDLDKWLKQKHLI